MDRGCETVRRRGGELEGRREGGEDEGRKTSNYTSNDRVALRELLASTFIACHTSFLCYYLIRSLFFFLNTS